MDSGVRISVERRISGPRKGRNSGGGGGILTRRGGFFRPRGKGLPTMLGPLLVFIKRQKISNRVLFEIGGTTILSSTARQIIFWLFIVIGALVLYQFLVKSSGKSAAALDLTALEGKIQSGKLKQLTFKQQEVLAVDKNNNEFKASLENQFRRTDLINEATEHDAP